VWALVWLVLGGPQLAAAAPPELQIEPPPDQQTEPLAEVGEHKPVLLLAADNSELGAQILRAVRIELNDVDVGLEQIELATPGLMARIEAGEVLVRERAALGLVWFERRPDGLTIYLVVGDGGMLRRPVLGVDEPVAAVEAAAVIIRHFTTDLIAGRPIGLTRFSADADAGHGRADAGGRPPVGPTATPSPPRAPQLQLLRERGYLRLQAAYVGQAWARERAWDSGAELSIGWRLAVGAHVGAAVALIPRFEHTFGHPTVSGVLTYRVNRYPLSLVAGYQHVWARSRLALDAQLRVVTELHHRRATDPIGELGLKFAGPTLRVIPAIEPRLQLDYLPLAQLSVFVALGLRVGLVDTVYAVSYEDDFGRALGQTVALQPNLVSPVVVVGVGVFL
jgi:hypothetical protein